MKPVQYKQMLSLVILACYDYLREAKSTSTRAFYTATFTARVDARLKKKGIKVTPARRVEEALEMQAQLKTMRIAERATA